MWSAPLASVRGSLERRTQNQTGLKGLIQDFLTLALLPVGVQLILCGGGCSVHHRTLAAPLASTHYRPVALSSQCDNEKCLQMLPNVPWKGGNTSD